MITAIIRNVVRENDVICVFAYLSDDSVRSYHFSTAQATEENIRLTIKQDIDAINQRLAELAAEKVRAEQLAELLQALENEIIR